MPEIERRVDEEQLRLLPSEGHESAQLDYKAGCNIRDRRELVAITKDIGAMNILGGYIVIGADDCGQPTGRSLTRTSRGSTRPTCRSGPRRRPSPHTDIGRLLDLQRP